MYMYKMFLMGLLFQLLSCIIQYLQYIFNDIQIPYYRRKNFVEWTYVIFNIKNKFEY